jgi:hypothetical protein
MGEVYFSLMKKNGAIKSSRCACSSRNRLSPRFINKAQHGRTDTRWRGNPLTKQAKINDKKEGSKATNSQSSKKPGEATPSTKQPRLPEPEKLSCQEQSILEAVINGT